MKFPKRTRYWFVVRFRSEVIHRYYNEGNVLVHQSRGPYKEDYHGHRCETDTEEIEEHFYRGLWRKGRGDFSMVKGQARSLAHANARRGIHSYRYEDKRPYIDIRFDPFFERRMHDGKIQNLWHCPCGHTNNGVDPFIEYAHGRVGYAHCGGCGEEIVIRGSSSKTRHRVDQACKEYWKLGRKSDMKFYRLTPFEKELVFLWHPGVYNMLSMVARDFWKPREIK